MMERSRLSPEALIHLPRHISFLRLIVYDQLKVGLTRRSMEEHLDAAMRWLCRAQDATGSGGVSGGYSWLDGWQPAYPETTGYIIPTFLDYARRTGDEAYIRRALRMADWECEIQMADGPVRGGIGKNTYPIVFNTGQVILGWTAIYRHTQEMKYIKAAREAADWLIRVQDEDGKWTRHSHHDVPHAYHSRVAWPLLEVYQLVQMESYRQAAEKNLRWVLKQSGESGWFRYMGFYTDEVPFTHTIAYTLRGLLESARRLEGDLVPRIWTAVEKAAERILLRYERRKRDPRGMPQYLPGTLKQDWSSDARYSCLTGNVQMAIVFMKLYRHNEDIRYFNAALKLIDQTCATQSFSALNAGIRGAVAGSYPIWGGYTRFGFPNWAAKFLADAVMLAEQIERQLEVELA